MLGPMLIAILLLAYSRPAGSWRKTVSLPDDVPPLLSAYSIPQGRMGTAEEVADVVVFLATRASYINGTVVHVNGGMYGG